MQPSDQWHGPLSSFHELNFLPFPSRMRVRWNKGEPYCLCASNRDTSTLNEFLWFSVGPQKSMNLPTLLHLLIFCLWHLSKKIKVKTKPKSTLKLTAPPNRTLWTACQSISTTTTTPVTIPTSMRELKSSLSKGNSNVWDLKRPRKLLRAQENSRTGLDNLTFLTTAS